MKTLACLSLMSILVLGCSSPTVETTKPVEATKTPSDQFHSQSDKVTVSGISYRIDECCWSTRLKTASNLGSDDSHKLFVVRLALVNEAQVPLTHLGIDMLSQDLSSYAYGADKFVFCLVDEKGAVYFPEKNIVSPESLGLRLMSPMNPGVETLGIIAFNVPDTHQYNLRLPSTERTRDKEGTHYFRLTPAPYSRQVAAEMAAQTGK